MKESVGLDEQWSWQMGAVVVWEEVQAAGWEAGHEYWRGCYRLDMGYRQQPA